MSGEADVILVPKADMEAMRKASGQMQESLEKAGQQAAADTKKELGDGVKKGINKGADKGLLKLRLSMASFALALGSVIKDALDKTLGGADEVVEEVKRRAENIRNMTGTAGAFGINQGEYAALTIGAKSLGIEADDIRGLFEGFASALDSDEMVKYRKVSDEKGLDTAFYKLLNTASFMDPAKAQTWLATTAQLGDSDATFANKISGVIRSMRTDGTEVNKRNLLTKLAGFDIDPAKLSESFDTALVQIGEMNKAEAKRNYDVFLAGTTEGQTDAVISREKSKAELESKELENITLKVKTANFQDKVDIAEMDATVSILNMLSNSGPAKAVENFVDEPSVSSAGNVVTETTPYALVAAGFGGFPAQASLLASNLAIDLLREIKDALGTKASNQHNDAINAADVETGGD